MASSSLISAKSKFMMYNSMCCLLKALEGKFITVDIRNDMVIEGKLESVESTMSLNMSKVILTNVIGIKTKLAKFYVNGRQIRYVHIPDEVDIIKAMTWEVTRKKIHQQRERDDTRRVFQRRQYLKEKKRNEMDKKESRQAQQSK